MIINLLAIFTTLLTTTLAFLYFISRKNKFNHLPIMFVLAIYFIFFTLTPLINTINEDFILFGNDVSNYIALANIHYTISILCILLTYSTFQHIRKPSVSSLRIQKEFTLEQEKRFSIAIRFSFAFCLLMVCFWAYKSGFGIRSLFFANVSNNTTFESFEGSYNYFKLFLESFIPIIGAAYISKINKKEFFFYFAIVLIIYLAMGFRFRVIVLVLTLTFLYFSKSKFNYTNILKVSILGVTFVSLMIIQGFYKSYLRDIAFSGQSEIVNQNKGYFSSFVRYSRNHISFASLIKYMDGNGGKIDYAETIFIQPFIRFVPKQFFENEQKPYPKAIKTSALSWGTKEGYMAGEAYGNVGEMYNAGKTPGVILLSLILGAILGSIKYRSQSKISLLIYCSLVSSLFHYITRGYFPGYLMLLAYILIGIFLLKIFMVRLK